MLLYEANVPSLFKSGVNETKAPKKLNTSSVHKHYVFFCDCVKEGPYVNQMRGKCEYLVSSCIEISWCPEQINHIYQSLQFRI